MDMAIFIRKVPLNESCSQSNMTKNGFRADGEHLTIKSAWLIRVLIFSYDTPLFVVLKDEGYPIISQERASKETTCPTPSIM